MKKLIYVALMSLFLFSCASHSGRVCGGPGGARCVDNTKAEKALHTKPVV